MPGAKIIAISPQIVRIQDRNLKGGDGSKNSEIGRKI